MHQLLSVGCLRPEARGDLPGASICTPLQQVQVSGGRPSEYLSGIKCEGGGVAAAHTLPERRRHVAACRDRLAPSAAPELGKLLGAPDPAIERVVTLEGVSQLERLAHRALHHCKLGPEEEEGERRGGGGERRRRWW